MTSTMLPIVLAFLFAQSAFALPTALVNFVDINEAKPVIDNGQLVSRAVTDGAFGWVDGADVPLYAQMVIQSINDQASSGDIASQAQALVLTINSIAELAVGIPGDSCESSALINAYSYAVGTGNSAGLRSALVNFVQRINSNIDTIVRLVNKPDSVRYSTGPRGNCLGGGRAYQFEEAWDDILNTANPFQIGLLNEEYCAAKRMYHASNIRSNNLGATVTASLTRHVTQVAQNAIGPVAQTGPRGNCLGGGRAYQFEEAWDDILNTANPFQIGLLNEEYCAAKRMYHASNIRSNNLGATVTASLTRHVTQVAQNAIGPVAQFLRVVSAGGNPSASAVAAKAALTKALSSVQY